MYMLEDSGEMIWALPLLVYSPNLQLRRSYDVAGRHIRRDVYFVHNLNFKILSMQVQTF